MKHFTVYFVILHLVSTIHLNFSIRNRQRRSTNVRVHSNDTNSIMNYLYKYGYLESRDNVTDEEMKGALKDFQNFAGMDPTGEMNEVTLVMMNRPRCGMPDRAKKERERRYLRNRVWPKNRLHYRINRYTKDLQRSTVDRVLKRAAKLWSEQANISLQPAQEHHDVDINVYFNIGDGPDGTLGLAYRPTNGTIQLDETETWSAECPEGKSLLQVITHEIGHSLGLRHTAVQDAVMYPYYMECIPNYGLHQDDIGRIRSLYGTPSVKVSSRNQILNPLCIDYKIDAAFTASDGYIYFIQKNQYWKLNYSFVILEGPIYIRGKWTELQESLDSVITLSNNVTYFFKHKYFWKYTGDKKMGKSKLISVGFKGIPDDIDASLLWNGNGKIYFFKGDQYWGFDPKQPVDMRVNSTTYPKSISNWNGLPNDLDAAVTVNGSSYFFKANKYYKYDDFNGRLVEGYPKDIGIYLLDCDI